MRLFIYPFVMVLLLVTFEVASANDAQIKRLIIRESIRQYPGNCPCPYSFDRAGRSCGARSAWSKPGGYSPICYESDITREMVERYR